MAKGTVKWFDCKKGFGFVINDEGKDVFVHYTTIQVDGFRCLLEGQTVEYEELKSDKGLQGKNVQIIDLPANGNMKTTQSSDREMAKKL